MKKNLKSHPYADSGAFERLMLLIATLVKYPGVGYRNLDILERKETHHNALEEVQFYLRKLAHSIGIELTENYPATATLRKDLEILRDHHILERRMYRWGYYLGTGVMSPDELKVAFNGLESQALKQGDPRMRQIYYQVKRRLRGFEGLEDGDLFYPVRQHLNHAINYTDPQEMMEKGAYRQTLFHHINTLETAIIKGQAIEISRKFDFYGDSRVGTIIIWPLQLIYHDIAWYLLYESCSNGHLVMGRINRFGNYCQIMDSSGRGICAQKQSLEQGHKLLDSGWGLKLGNLEEQSQELAGELALINVKVRFFPPVSQFIEEGELRHPRQKLKRGKLDPTTSQPQYIDYCLRLPPRSLDEFSFWVKRYGESAQVISPDELVQRHKQSALALVSRYGCGEDNID